MLRVRRAGAGRMDLHISRGPNATAPPAAATVPGMGDAGGAAPVIDAQSAAVAVGSGDATYTVHPAEVLPLHAAHPADGATVRRFTTHYACSCPAWRFHRERNVRLRSCKHLEAVLGEEYERVRLKAAVHALISSGDADRQAEQADSGALAQSSARPRSAERRPSSDEGARRTPPSKRQRPSVPEDEALFVSGPDEASAPIGRRDVSVSWAGVRRGSHKGEPSSCQCMAGVHIRVHRARSRTKRPVGRRGPDRLVAQRKSACGKHLPKLTA